MTAADTVLVDTDVVIDHLRGARRLVPGGPQLAYSVITRSELFAGAVDVEPIRVLLGPMLEVTVTREIAEVAGAIRRTHGTELEDALIAATAISIGAPLLTRNRKHYRTIKGLTLAS